VSIVSIPRAERMEGGNDLRWRLFERLFCVVPFRRKLKPTVQWCGSNQPVSEHGSSG
jgi:hypothetical protein